MSLKYPFLLFLIPPLLALLYFAVRGAPVRRVLAFPLAQRNLRASPFTQASIWIPFALRALSVVLLVVALCRPQSSSSQVRRLSEGIDIMIALDVSASMRIEDTGVEDRNRLDVAKDVVKNFIAGRQDDRIGFLMFSGEAVTLCPPTLDYTVIQESVNQAQMDVLRDGTAIGDAIATSAARLKDSNAKSRVIILITDGDSNMGSIAPLTAGEIAAGYGLKVYAIALGTEGVVKVPQTMNVFGFQRKVYSTTTSSINPQLLQKIATETGGQFYRASDEDSLKRVFGEINKLERTKVETKDRVLWEEHFQPFLLFGLLFLLADLILRLTKFRVLPD
jgi:Ca-activated chloride channel family protein